MTEETKAKRAYLHSLSLTAKELIESGDAETINEGLQLIYAKDGHKELKTFKQWIKEGKAVRKGEKALLLWAKPLSEQKEKEETTAEDQEGRDFFPLAYVFSNLQVEPLKRAA